MKDGFWVAILVTCAGALGWLALGELRRKGRRHTSSHDGAGGDGGGWFDGHGHSSDHGSGSDAGGSDGDGGEDGVGGGDGGGGGD